MSFYISNILSYPLLGFVFCFGVIFCDYPEASVEKCELLDVEHAERLRNELLADSCLREVEAVQPHEIVRAARLFHRDGFVVVNNAMTADKTNNVKEACDDLMQMVFDRDPKLIGNRGPFRWSLSAASKTGHVVHVPQIASLIDNPNITPIIKAIFGNDQYICRGARGDFNMPGSGWQDLHSDVYKEWLVDPAPTEFADSGRLNIRDLPVPHVVVNYYVIHMNAINAPIRQIPMTQNSQRPIPELNDEPLWMKRSSICPAKAGTAIIRDPRAWHGGSPNLSNQTRCMPNMEYYASWFRFRDHTNQMTTSLPREVYDTLSDFGKKLAAEIVALPGQKIDTSPKEKAMLFYDSHRECYKKMGFSEQEMQEYDDKGMYLHSIRQVQGGEDQGIGGFYRRKQLSPQQQPSKTEL